MQVCKPLIPHQPHPLTSCLANAIARGVASIGSPLLVDYRRCRCCCCCYRHQLLLRQLAEASQAVLIVLLAAALWPAWQEVALART